MKTREALREYLEEQGIARGESPEDWYRDRWFQAVFRKAAIDMPQGESGEQASASSG